MTTVRLELAAVRAPFSVAGWVGLGVDAGAVLAAAALVPRPVPVLGLFVLNAGVSGVASVAIWRRSLRRVVAPIPVGAVVIPSRFLSARLLGSVLATAAVLALSIRGVVSPGVLGAGVGAEVGLLWSARKIGEFERRDGRRVVRATRRRRGQPALYAV